MNNVDGTDRGQSRKLLLIGQANFDRKGEREMRKYFVLVGLLLLTAGLALAQDSYPKVETAPAFMYVRTVFDQVSFNCAGGGGTFQYNVTKAVAIAADLGGCKYFNNTIASQDKIDGSLFTYLFGPRFTYRNGSKFRPFALVNFGGARLKLTCGSGIDCPGNPSISKNAFAMTVGGGFDIQLSKKISLRPVQAEYLYTRFGNDCPLNACAQNTNQNSFRLKSGIVIAWGSK
jgi:opacity protein-like surface antigen